MLLELQKWTVYLERMVFGNVFAYQERLVFGYDKPSRIGNRKD